MINILPIENKVSIKKEYLRRMIVVFGFLSFTVVIIASFLLIFLLFLVKKEKNDYGAYLSLEQKHSTFLDQEVVTSFILDTNAKVTAFEQNNNKNIKASEAIKSIINAKTKGITINYLSFGGKKISFNGIAQTRNNLLLFVDNLKKEPAFKTIDSPLSNFLKENDVRFSITIEFYEN